MRKSIGSGRKQPIKCRGTSLLPRCHSNMTRLMLSSGVFCLFDLMFGLWMLFCYVGSLFIFVSVKHFYSSPVTLSLFSSSLQCTQIPKLNVHA